MRPCVQEATDHGGPLPRQSSVGWLYFFRFLRLAMKPTANKPAPISSAVPGSGVTVTAAKIDGVKQTAKMLIARSLI